MISQANPVGIELYTYLAATQPRLVRQISPIWRGSLLDGLSNTITPCCNNVSFSFSFFSKRVLVTAKLPVLCNIVFFFFFDYFVQVISPCPSLCLIKYIIFLNYLVCWSSKTFDHSLNNNSKILKAHVFLIFNMSSVFGNQVVKPV